MGKHPKEKKIASRVQAMNWRRKMTGDGNGDCCDTQIRQSKDITKEIERDISPPWSGNKEIKRERALTPDALILSEVRFVIPLLCSQNRFIIGIAGQRPEPYGLTWERLESWNPRPT